MIEFPNSYRFDYMTASGAMGYYGNGWTWEKPLIFLNIINPSLFANVTKTITYHPKKGNKFAVHILNNGIVNALGLPNPGIDSWIENLKTKQPLILSLFGNINEISSMLLKIKDIKNIVGIELNFSCPSVEGYGVYDCAEICSYVYHFLKTKKMNLGIIAKLNILQYYFIYDIYPYIDAISINSVPWNMIFPGRKYPFKVDEKSLWKAGISGKIAQVVNWPFIRDLIKLDKVPIIGCSVWEYRDIQRLWNLGVNAISFGSIHMLRPWLPTKWVRRERNEKK